jgi:hypothetical protein
MSAAAASARRQAFFGGGGGVVKFSAAAARRDRLRPLVLYFLNRQFTFNIHALLSSASLKRSAKVKRTLVAFNIKCCKHHRMTLHEFQHS